MSARSFIGTPWRRKGEWCWCPHYSAITLLTLHAIVPQLYQCRWDENRPSKDLRKESPSIGLLPCLSVKQYVRILRSEWIDKESFWGKYKARMAGEKTRVVMTNAPGIRHLPHLLGYNVTQNPVSAGVRAWLSAHSESSHRPVGCLNPDHSQILQSKVSLEFVAIRFTYAKMSSSLNEGPNCPPAAHAWAQQWGCGAVVVFCSHYTTWQWRTVISCYPCEQRINLQI